MPKLGLGLSLPQTRSASAPLIPASGLSLWLKADTGVTQSSYNYASTIVISGTSNPSFAGTYTAGSVPNYNPDDGIIENYSLSGPGGKAIYWNGGDPYFSIFDESVTERFTSANGVTWEASNPFISEIIVSGFTGDFSGANGTYTRGDEWSSFNRVGGGFYIDEYGLKENEHETLIATPPANYSGFWTPATFINQVTLSGSSIGAINGVYTRASPGIQDIASFSGPSTLSFTWGDETWIVGGEDFYSDGGRYGLTNWNVFNSGGTPPTGVTTTASKPVGLPTSTTVMLPSGSISGVVTTTSANTEFVVAWADQSSSGRNASNNNGYGTHSLIGDKSFITFGEDSSMIVPTIWEDVSFVGTIIVMARFASSNAGILLAQESSSGIFEFGRGYSSTNAPYIQTSEIDVPDTIVSSSVANNNTNYVIGTTFNTSSASLYLNGASVGTGSVNSNTGTYNTFIGGASSIAEMIVYNRVLTTEERQEVEAYLNTKYAIY